MELETIDIYQLKELRQLSAVRCADLSEAAAVCLDFHDHAIEVELISEGDLKSRFKLIWENVTQQMKDSRGDMGYIVESGAYCLAMLIIEKLTGWKVVRQSQKRTGFDYWLGDLQNMGLAINEMHKKAMELADEAFYAKSQQRLDRAQEKYLAAFEYEKAAAMLLINEYEQEPTRSVLFRSAACLLLNLPFPKEEHFRQSEKMVAHGLSGNPPEEIAEELREERLGRHLPNHSTLPKYPGRRHLSMKEEEGYTTQVQR